MLTLVKTVTTCASSSVSGQRRIPSRGFCVIECHNWWCHCRERQLIQQQSKAYCQSLSVAIIYYQLSSFTSSFYQLPSVLSVPTNNCTEDNQRHKQDVDGIYEVRRERRLADRGFGVGTFWHCARSLIRRSMRRISRLWRNGQLMSAVYNFSLLTCDITDITRETIWVLATEAQKTIL